MHALITGASGTVGRALTARLRAAGARVTPWDRARVPCDRYEPMERFVREVSPDVLYHLAIASRPTGRPGEGWLINYEWPSELAWIARLTGIRFVFTSTVMVFGDRARGPFGLDSVPDAEQGYGHEKRRAEERVFHQCPDALVVRLGWQIADEPDSNNMWAWLTQKARQGPVRASTRWLPACSFVDDTADALVRAASAAPGLYQLDQNTGFSFFEIATALALRAGEPLALSPTDDVVQDQRMLDGRLALPPLQERLPSLVR